MSYGRREEDGKDTVYFLTREDLKEEEEEDSAQARTESDNDQSGAYNPETKEINWDCPCLEAEPKGSDCISAFQAMQTCFQEFPEYYSDQLRDDDKKVTGNNDDSDAAAEHNSTYDSQETVSTPDNINVQNESLDNTITSTSTPAVL